MSVEIWSMNALESEVVTGDMAEVCMVVNLAAAQGKMLGIFDADEGGQVAVNLQNIIKMKERDGAFIG